MIPFDYTKPTTVDQAISSGIKDGSSFIAGGTNLVDLMKRGVTAPEKIIDITSLPLNQLEKREDGLFIGALTLNSAVAKDPVVVSEFPLLAMAISSGASQQIRNMATTGGNMLQRTRCPYFYDTVSACNKREPGTGCSAIKGYNRMHAIFGGNDRCIAVHPSDMCVALSALNSSVIVKGASGERKIPFVDFHKLPENTPEKDNVLQKGEIIVGVSIPSNNFSKHSSYLKVRDRASYAFALVSVAAALDIKGGVIKEARLAMGGVAHKPWRLFEVEHFMRGKPANELTFKSASVLALKGATGYGFNNFKLKLAPNSIVQSLKQAAGLA